MWPQFVYTQMSDFQMSWKCSNTREIDVVLNSTLALVSWIRTCRDITAVALEWDWRQKNDWGSVSVRNVLNLKRMRHALPEEIVKKQQKWTRLFKGGGRTQATEDLDVISGCICRWSIIQLDCNTLWETAGKIVHLDIDTSAMSRHRWSNKEKFIIWTSVCNGEGISCIRQRQLK